MARGAGREDQGTGGRAGLGGVPGEWCAGKGVPREAGREGRAKSGVPSPGGTGREGRAGRNAL